MKNWTDYKDITTLGCAISKLIIWKEYKKRKDIGFQVGNKLYVEKDIYEEAVKREISDEFYKVSHNRNNG